MFMSQFNQDKNVLEVYNYKQNGFFVEIGAYDGIESSNTYVLEKKYNWSGLCVECNPKYYKILCNTRNCFKSDNAVYNINGKILPFYDSGGYAGLIETNNHKHIINDPVINVITKTLTSLLDEINAPSFIEYLSLDTEGSEFEILKSHDFNKYKFGYICVEHNSIIKNRLDIKELLENNGYKFVRENGDNKWGVIDDEYILIDLNKYNKSKE
jgi:FkbM family methyltransferase